jgi:hypothetical protein
LRRIGTGVRFACCREMVEDVSEDGGVAVVVIVRDGGEVVLAGMADERGSE